MPSPVNVVTPVTGFPISRFEPISGILVISLKGLIVVVTEVTKLLAEGHAVIQ
jgi:hypothetical protein